MGAEDLWCLMVFDYLRVRRSFTPAQPSSRRVDGDADGTRQLSDVLLLLIYV
jgi:hypothetical protein